MRFLACREFDFCAGRREQGILPDEVSGRLGLQRGRAWVNIRDFDARSSISGSIIADSAAEKYASSSQSTVPVVQRIERWFPKPVMWVRFPPGTLGSTPLPSSAEFSDEAFSEKQKRSGHIHVAGAFAKGLPHLCRHGGCSVPPMVTGEKPGAGLGLPMKA